MKKGYSALLAFSVLVIIVAISITFLPGLKNQYDKVALFVSQHDDLFYMYQNMANPYVRYVRIPEGLRKEQVALIYQKNLNWDNGDIFAFLNKDDPNSVNLEGHYFPSTYVLLADADGESVKDDMVSKFNQNYVNTIQKTKSTLNKNVINQETVLKIASLIQRESGAHDQRLISGIIWNRIFNGMSLDIDATLQYAKGNEEDGWWPQVHSADKKIDSPYNTYKNTGLPPSPIASPGNAAIEAAYNPLKTNCLFYLHDANHQIHCSATYAQHQAYINEYL